MRRTSADETLPRPRTVFRNVPIADGSTTSRSSTSTRRSLGALAGPVPLGDRRGATTAAARAKQSARAAGARSANARSADCASTTDWPDGTDTTFAPI